MIESVMEKKDMFSTQDEDELSVKEFYDYTARGADYWNSYGNPYSDWGACRISID